MLTVSVGSTMFFWFSRMQSESQEVTAGQQAQLIKKAISEAKIKGDAQYNALGDNLDRSQPSTLTFYIENTGSRPLTISPTVTAPRTEFTLSDSSKVVCISDLSATCSTSEDGIYAGSASDVIFKSTNGTGWSEISVLNPAIKTYDFAEMNDTLYAVGVGSQNYGQIWRLSSPSSEIVMIESGYTFDAIDAFSSIEVFNGTMYAGARDNSGSGVKGGQIHNSTDGYQWTPTEYHNTGNVADTVTDLEVFGNYIYAIVGAADLIYGSVNGKILRSDGSSWTTQLDLGTGEGVYALAVNGSAIYAGVGNSTQNASVFKSTDGVTWTRIATLGEGPGHTEAVVSLGEFNGVLYAGTRTVGGPARIYRSSDETTWTEVNNSLAVAVNDFAVFNDYIYAAFEGGGVDDNNISRSSDGLTWEDVSDGLRGEVMYALTNFTYCTDRSVKCISGCDSNIKAGEVRKMELELSNTPCDVSAYGEGARFNFKINFGSEAQTHGTFTKERISTTSSSPCASTYPFCTGTCSSGTCGWGPYYCECRS